MYAHCSSTSSRRGTPAEARPWATFEYVGPAMGRDEAVALIG